jgi:hypothetical protein
VWRCGGGLREETVIKVCVGGVGGDRTFLASAVYMSRSAAQPER